MNKNKNVSRTVTLLLCLSFAAIGCIPQNSGSPDEEPRGTIDFSKYEETYDELPGRWDWIRTTHFDTSDGLPFTETPSNSGIRKILHITGDQIELVKIELAQEDTLRSDSEPQDSFFQNVEWGIRGDTLATKVKAYEGPETVYVRIEEDL